MFWITALCLTALSLQVNCQNLVSQVHMVNVTTVVIFRQSGPDVTGSFENATGLTGAISISIRPLWFHYDVEDKCSTTQLGADIAGLTTTTTFPNDFTLSATTLDDLEGKSLVLESTVTACASIQQEGDYITAAAYLRETIFGNIFFRQHSVSGSTFINSDLKTAASFTEASWFVAKNDVDCDNIGDPTQIEIFNPDNIGEGSCNMNTHSNCAIGDLSGKLGSARVATGSVPDRMSYTDNNLPLFGDNNIADKYLIVYDPNDVQNAVCSKIDVFKQRNAHSTFSHGGISGTLEFSQRSPFDPTLIMTHLQGLNSNAGGYHVHDFPVPLQSVPSENLCHPDVVAGHLNPYAIPGGSSYPAPQTATDDLYETGDLSSKHGTLAGTNKYGPIDLTDWNLPLFGRNSVVGRSIVIHRNDADGTRWVCSNIELDGAVISARAVFTAPVIGHVFFTQPVDNPETTIFARLNYFDGRSPTLDHSWQISTNKVGRGMDCSSVGMIFNPSGIWNDDSSYPTICSSDPRFCKLGDLSGRHGDIGVGQTSTVDRKAEEFYTDSTVHLSSPISLIDRSVVIMDASGGSDTLSCATIQNLHDLKFSAKFDSGNFNGKVTFSQRAGFGQIPTMVSVEGLNGFSSDSHVLEIRSTPLFDGNNPCADLGDVYNPLEVTESSPQTDDQYKIGDLSRRGSRETWYDFNLPMKGPTSIMGHSLAILNQNSVVACANIAFDFDADIDGYLVKAKLDFSGPADGEIHISQIFYEDETLSDASIVVDLKGNTDTVTMNHNWHVHVYPIAGDATAASGRCASAGPHYDPFMAQIGDAAVDYSTQCGIQTPLRCEVGDQANKLGTYDLGGGAHVYNDVYLPLAGEYSVQGRSIVVHISGRGAARLACADIIPVNGLKVSASFLTQQNFTKTSAATAFATAINTYEENIVVEVISQTDEETKISIHFLGKDRSMLQSEFVTFVESASNRQTLGIYSSITIMSSASQIISSVVVLTLSLIIGHLMSSA